MEELWPLNKRIIVFACHPDDETWGCGGTIAKKINEGYEAIIVVVTDGRNLFRVILGIDVDPTPEEVKKIRREEVIRATKILGVPKENLLFLDFEDAALAKYEKEAEERITEIIEKYPPVEVYYTYVNDGNLDHQALNRIMRRSLRKLRSTPLKYQYSIRHKYSRVGPLMERLLSLFRKNRIEVDISENVNLKEKAAKEFKTEVSTVSNKQVKPLEDDIDRYLKNKEIFYIDK
jgi:LmbE family N-acetylglucosaminyl deacetylase